MLSRAYILPDPCTLRLPDRFRARSIYIFTRHGHSYCIFCFTEIDCTAKGLSFSTEHWSPAKPYLDWEIWGWKDWVHWDHSRGGEILVRGWTCSLNALQKMAMEPLWGRSKAANNVWVSISTLVTVACIWAAAWSLHWLIHQLNIRGLPHGSYRLLFRSVAVLLSQVRFFLIKSAVL